MYSSSLRSSPLSALLLCANLGLSDHVCMGQNEPHVQGVEVLGRRVRPADVHAVALAQGDDEQQRLPAAWQHSRSADELFFEGEEMQGELVLQHSVQLHDQAAASRCAPEDGTTGLHLLEVVDGWACTISTTHISQHVLDYDAVVHVHSS